MRAHSTEQTEVDLKILCAGSKRCSGICNIRIGVSIALKAKFEMLTKLRKVYTVMT